MKKIIIVTLLLIISAILLGDMEIKHYDTKDMISIIIKDRKLINERRKNANLDSLEIDTSNITDSLLYNYLVSTLFNENKID
ncbi:MAG: hypothetical protein RAO94_03305, partial [Candidatus Stygibacter australis]|nr:hypothetical protein [Candidatus Stygibacter australis]